MNTLANYDGDRKNNFSTLRILLAWLVLYGHSYAIQGDGTFKDPLNTIFQGSTWIGAVAVDCFFIISGFLVTASIINRTIIEYTVSRILRIFPALIIVVFFTVFIFGPLVTSLSFSDYFASKETYTYLSNSIAFNKMQWTLPGLFDNQRTSAVNGSLWSLTVESRCYALLALFAAFNLLKTTTIANVSIAALLIFGYFHFDQLPLIGTNNKNWVRTTSFFLTGVFYYINRKHIPLDNRLALLALVIVIKSFGEEWFKYTFPITVAYLVFYLAYKTPVLKTDIYIGDISYGVYIFAFPVQQTVNFYLPHIHTLGNTVISTIIVLPLAYFSWHLIEKPSLGIKNKILNRKSGI